MSDHDNSDPVRAEIEGHGLKQKPKSILDRTALAVGTFGVGYLPLAPGTFGSLVGVLIYLAATWSEAGLATYFSASGGRPAAITAWFGAANVSLFLLLSLLAIWASGRTAKIIGRKDPQIVVVDEVIGQLIVFFFVPFGLGWQFVLAGFLLFRLFDIWKPYPIDSLQGLPAGIGICADDILAGCYAGVCLAIMYAISVSL